MLDSVFIWEEALTFALTQACGNKSCQSFLFQSRTGTGTYTYDAVRPHAVASVQGGGGHERSYEYDGQGRMTLERQFVAGAQVPADGMREGWRERGMEGWRGGGRQGWTRQVGGGWAKRG